MIELVRSWLTGVTCAALIAALADCLMPKGAVKQVGRLVCGLLLLWTALRPVLRAEPEELMEGMQGMQGQITAQQEVLEQQHGSILKTLIERESAAYIVDKAAELGLSCRAAVTCAAQEAGTWIPWSVRVSGVLQQGQQEALSRLLESELNIPVQRQSFLAGGELP